MFEPNKRKKEKERRKHGEGGEVERWGRKTGVVQGNNNGCLSAQNANGCQSAPLRENGHKSEKRGIPRHS